MARRKIAFHIPTHPDDPFPLPANFKLPETVWAEEDESPAEVVLAEIATLNDVREYNISHNDGETYWVELWGRCVGVTFTIVVEHCCER